MNDIIPILADAGQMNGWQALVSIAGMVLTGFFIWVFFGR